MLEDRTLPTAVGLDSSFAGSGLDSVTGSSAFPATGLVVQPADNKVLVLNGNGLVRLNADGSPDFGFNAPFFSNFTPQAVALQPDGTKILLVGATYQGSGATATPELNLERLSTVDGSVDFGFGFGPHALDIGLPPLTAVGNTVFGSLTITSVAVQADNKVVVTGFVSNALFGGTVEMGFVARVNTNGTADTAFGSNGKGLATPPGNIRTTAVANGQRPDRPDLWHQRRLVPEPEHVADDLE
jgi:uncharacterized delta-60 repeat protein